jgi:hypothetical protein
MRNNLKKIQTPNLFSIWDDKDNQNFDDWAVKYWY